MALYNVEADWAAIDGEVLDCSTLSISYQSNGLASISFSIYKKIEDGVPFNTGSAGLDMCAGGVRFKGLITDQSLVPSTEMANANEWKVTAIAIGCRDPDCGSPC